MTLPSSIAAALILIFTCVATPLHCATLETQRQLFRAAEQALKQGNSQRYLDLKRQLADYPLLPYLEYTELRPRLAGAAPETVRRFLTKHGEGLLSERLRNAWLALLAKRGRWHQYLKFYRPDDSTERRCRYLHGLIATGQRSKAFAEVQELWLVGRSQPAACNPVFEAWRQAGKLTQALIWERIALAMDNGQTRLASHLKKMLPASQRPWVNRWLRVRKNPALIGNQKLFAADHHRRPEILLYGLERLARQDVKRAASVWNTLKQRYRFDREHLRDGERILGAAYLRHGYPDALARLDKVEPDEDLELHRERILAALVARDWQRVNAWIDTLPAPESEEERWRYWKGRALQKLGRKQEANKLLKEVSRDRTYYAFLAADRSGSDYYLKNVPVRLDPAQEERIESLPVVRRAAELRALGRLAEARSEWWWLRRNLEPEELKGAALIARDWGWHALAIFTLAAGKYWDDLELRFPLHHLDLVKRNANSNGISTPWTLAVLRQESAFNAAAVSPAGARGLMQLMPATAREVAKRLGRPRPGKRDLLQPATNIPLGTAYLSRVYKRFNRNPVLATAAYNAGPGRVKQWLPRRTLDADIWVETIPFDETRNYVKRVMGYTIIYEKRLGKKPGSIVKRMRSVTGER